MRIDMTKRSFDFILIGLALLGPFPSAFASDGVWGADDIRKEVRAYLASVGKPIDEKVSIGPLDDRMHVSACASTPEIAPRSAYSSSLVIHCEAPQAWTYTVRLDADAATMPQPSAITKPVVNGPVQEWHVVVPRVSIPSGSVITASMVEERVVNTPPGGAVLKSLDEVVGLRITAAVAPGMALSARNVARAPTILKGETVVIAAEGEGFAIESQGRAEEDGYQGDLLAVRNVKSGLVVTGRVARSGLVLVH
jgi:flagella basal body P-ring formation protein FlgA